MTSYPKPSATLSDRLPRPRRRTSSDERGAPAAWQRHLFGRDRPFAARRRPLRPRKHARRQLEDLSPQKRLNVFDGVGGR